MMVLRRERIALVATILIAAVHTAVNPGIRNGVSGRVNRLENGVRVRLFDVSFFAVESHLWPLSK
jgi:hypothetical protein